MSKVRAICHEHEHEVVITSDDVVLVETIYPGDTRAYSYRFPCPEYGSIQVNQAERNIVGVLSQIGVMLQQIEMPPQAAVFPPGSFKRPDDNEIVDFVIDLAINQTLEDVVSEWGQAGEAA